MIGKHIRTLAVHAKAVLLITYFREGIVLCHKLQFGHPKCLKAMGERPKTMPKATATNRV